MKVVPLSGTFCGTWTQPQVQQARGVGKFKRVGSGDVRDTEQQ